VTGGWREGEGEKGTISDKETSDLGSQEKREERKNQEIKEREESKLSAPFD